MAKKTINEGLLDKLRRGIKQSFKRGLDKKIEKILQNPDRQTIEVGKRYAKVVADIHKRYDKLGY
tara:strand:+ start:3327 stop:3521 length:195 start_codon:yes stop_codon:yes gene_type:complete